MMAVCCGKHGSVGYKLLRTVPVMMSVSEHRADMSTKRHVPDIWQDQSCAHSTAMTVENDKVGPTAVQ